MELYFYNDDDEVHEIFVTTEEKADPDRSNTSTDGFLAHAGPRTANRSASGGNFTVPEDAEALYVWCWLDDHEAEGEHLVVPVADPHTGTDEAPLLDGGLSAAALLALGAWVFRRRASP